MIHLRDNKHCRAIARTSKRSPYPTPGREQATFRANARSGAGLLILPNCRRGTGAGYDRTAGLCRRPPPAASSAVGANAGAAAVAGEGLLAISVCWRFGAGAATIARQVPGR
ncbi:hypothetical protein KCP74_06160 [Salmonella enterica subsp. enterica]|nr:hypothetical protein KCP74_06160 [Salmonella enterica subsp. enterica]